MIGLACNLQMLFCHYVKAMFLFWFSEVPTWFSQSTESGQTNPGFQRADSSYHVKLDSEGNSEIDWCEVSRERISLGEKIGTETVGATFHGKLCLENGNMTNCIVKTTKGK